MGRRVTEKEVNSYGEIRPVKGLAPDLEDVSSCYQISSAGILYGIRGNPTHPSFDKDGYLIAGLSRWPNKTNKYIRLHKLVALAFMPNYIEAAKRGMEIDHKDGISKIMISRTYDW